MEDKIKMLLEHDVKVIRTREQKFQVTCKGRAHRGLLRNRAVHECVLAHDGSIHCSCYKPTLLHKPCSHVIAACREAGVQPGSFVSLYYTKQSIAVILNHEVYGYAMVGTFTEENTSKVYIPDPEMKIHHPGHRRTCRIRNGMDKAEARRSQKCCTSCGGFGHSYKRCPLMDVPGTAEAGPSGNPTDGAPSDFRASTARHSCSMP